MVHVMILATKLFLTYKIINNYRKRNCMENKTKYSGNFIFFNFNHLRKSPYLLLKSTKSKENENIIDIY